MIPASFDNFSHVQESGSAGVCAPALSSSSSWLRLPESCPCILPALLLLRVLRLLLLRLAMLASLRLWRSLKLRSVRPRRPLPQN